MKATLEFDDKADLHFALAGFDLYYALTELDQALRSTLKHGDLSDDARHELQALRDMIPHELLSRLGES